MSTVLACGCSVVAPGDGIVRIKLLVPADQTEWLGLGGTSYKRRPNSSFAQWSWRLPYPEAFDLNTTLRRYRDTYCDSLFTHGSVTVQLLGGEDEDVIVFADRAPDDPITTSFIVHGPLAAALRRELRATFPKQP